MIALIRGTLVSKTPESVIIEVGGGMGVIGYEIFIPLSTYSTLPELGKVATLQTITFFKDDTIRVFGFAALPEKELFLLLLTVTGVGPKLARNILSGASVEKLKRSILSGDASTFKGLPGIGKKTAERLMLELKDKVFLIKAQGGDTQDSEVMSQVPVLTDVVSALKNLGYKGTDIEDKVQKVFDKITASEGLEKNEPSFEELFKASLQTLAPK
ncbi:MAG: Holliday junction branch migration protein RuvA [Deltaproteobacteria bacterium]|nr:Holliday junction branch migration protein RuvA [Deltaproteobacteria bacterium]